MKLFKKRIWLFLKICCKQVNLFKTIQKKKEDKCENIFKLVEQSFTHHFSLCTVLLALLLTWTGELGKGKQPSAVGALRWLCRL